MDENQALAPHTGSNVDLAISAWIDSKFRRSTSERTRFSYHEIITAFRAGLRSQGLDLDSPLPGKIALLAQAFAGHSAKGKQIKPATYNLRLAVLSSFYVFCRKQGDDSPLYLMHNPIERLSRANVQRYANAVALEEKDVYTRLHAIDQSTDKGARDYALLAVLLQTGRRASEVCDLQWRDVVLYGSKATLTFRHCKGGKVMRDELPAATTGALLRWLHTWYGADLGTLAPDAPLWINVAEHSFGRYGEAIGTKSLSVICKTHLGTSKVHSTRHSFAMGMLDLGANVHEIKRRLGHESLATTDKYLEALQQATNSKADELAARYGIE